MKLTLLATALGLVLVGQSNAFSYYTDHWMSGTKLYASASSSSDGEDEYASVDLQITGPSGNTSVAYECIWYDSSVQVSKTLTAAGTHHARSNHWSQSVAAFLVSSPIEAKINVETNFGNPSQSGSTCTYTQDCPGTGGGSTRLCSHVSATQQAPTVQGVCLPYFKMTHGLAVKLNPIGNWFCIGENSMTSNQQGGCTAP